MFEKVLNLKPQNPYHYRFKQASLMRPLIAVCKFRAQNCFLGNTTFNISRIVSQVSDPCQSRTGVTSVKKKCLNRLTNGP